MRGLADEQKEEVRRGYQKASRTHGKSALARKYGVSRSCIDTVINGFSSSTQWQRKNKKKSREYQNEYRRKRSSYYSKYQQARTKAKFKILGRLKMLYGCHLCRARPHPCALDFHHRDPSTKKFGLSTGCASRKWSALCEEIKKCVILCANCHRRVGFGDLKEKRWKP